MPIVDEAADWKSANADRTQVAAVRQVDPDAGPADSDTLAQGVQALQYDLREGPVAADGTELSATTCRFELPVADVGFQLRQRHRVTDENNRTWAVDEVETDSTGALYRAACTLTRPDQS